MWDRIRDYFEDLRDDIDELGEELRERLLKKPFKRQRKIHTKVKKKVGKRGRPALALAERIRGVIYVIVSASIIFATLIAYTEGVTGVKEIVVYLIRSWFGRVIAFLIGLSYLIYGVWKIIMGSD